MSKYGFNGRWLFKIRYNSRIGYEDTCKIVLKLQAENAELKNDNIRLRKFYGLCLDHKSTCDQSDYHADGKCAKNGCYKKTGQ